MNMEHIDLKKFEPVLTGIIADAVSETFLSYFSVNISADKFPVRSGSQREPIVSEAVVSGDTGYGAIVVSFEREGLVHLAKAVFPPEIAEQKDALEGCAAEIANIVGTRVKNFLNDQGFGLQISTPVTRLHPSRDSSFLHVSFKIIDGSLTVDVIFKYDAPQKISCKYPA